MSLIEKNGIKINSKFLNLSIKKLFQAPILNLRIFGVILKKSSRTSPINKNLIEKREEIQRKIDEWHKKNKEKDFNKKDYTEFLKSISYIVEKKKILILKQKCR